MNANANSALVSSAQETIVLVSCVGEKLSHAAPAKDLYTSDWFVKARAYAEQMGDRWYIISALHHVVDPDRVIAPYNAVVNDMKAHEHRAWGTEVARQIGARITKPTRLVILAGVAYRSAFSSQLGLMTRFPVQTEVPMEGLGIGKQKAWLLNAVRSPLIEHEANNG